MIRNRFDAMSRLLRTALVLAAVGASLAPTAAQPGVDANGARAADWMTAVPLTQSAAATRPADGAVVEQTPPDFSWPALKVGTHYTLSLEFPDGKARSRATSNNWLNWSEPLPPGDYAWRVAATTPQGTVDSAVRKFHVPRHAVPFVVPDADVLVARARAKPHPRALPDKPLLAALLAERAQDFALLSQQVDAGAAAAAGHRREPVGDLAAVESHTFAAVDRATALVLAYVATPDQRRYAQALEQALALAAWDPHGSTSYARADQAARGVAATLALAYDSLEPRLDRTQRETLLAAIETRLDDLYRGVVGDARVAVQPYDSHGNQTLFYVAMISTLLVGDLPAADSWLRDTLPLALCWLSPWGGEDGAFANGTAYAQWTTGDLLIPWYVLRSSVGIDVAQKAWVRNHARFLAYFAPPGAPTGAFGDGAELKLEEQWARFAKGLAQFAPTPLGRWYAAQLHGEDPTRPQMLLAPRADGKPAAYPVDTPNAALFPSIGWVAMHSNLADAARTSVYFKSSPFGSFNHSHADQNSFVVSANGEPLAIDSGYYDGYATAHWRQWYKQTRAHNAITFDGGHGQPVFEDSGEVAPGHLAHFTDTAAYTVVSGDASKAYGAALDVAERTLVYLRPDTLVVHDRLAATAPHTWEWNLHARERMTARDGGVAIRSGAATLCVAMLGTPTAFSQRDSFDAAPGDGRPQWHGVFAVTEPATSAELVAVLRVGCPAAPIVSRRTAEGWQLELAGFRVTLVDGAALVQPQG